MADEIKMVRVNVWSPITKQHPSPYLVVEVRMRNGVRHNAYITISGEWYLQNGTGQIEEPIQWPPVRRRKG